MNTIDLEVQGMSCGSCIDHVTRALKPILGVTDIAVDLKSGHVRVTDTLDGDPQRLVSALGDAGYPARLGVGPAAQPKQGGCCCR